MQIADCKLLNVVPGSNSYFQIPKSELLVNIQRRLACQHRFPADTYVRDASLVQADGDMNVARPTHLCTLQADDRFRFIGGHDLVFQQIAPERSAGDAGRRVLADAELRREHPAV